MSIFGLFGSAGAALANAYLAEPHNMERWYQAALQQAVYQPQCIHVDCPVCAENRKKYEEAMNLIREQKLKKQEDYKKRCEDYMKWFRAKGKDLE